MKTRAVLELILAGALWGFGFVAAVWALESFGPMTTTAFRFLVGGGVSFLASRRLRNFVFSNLTHQTQSPNVMPIGKIAKCAALPGLWLALTLVLQTWGLQYTTPTKSGFITTLYVLMVPILELIWFRKPISKLHWIFVGIAMLGTAMICQILQADSIIWNFGDLLTLLCAFAASLQIFWYVFVKDESSDVLFFNGWQSAWALPIPLLAALYFEHLPDFSQVPLKAWIGLLMLTFGSTLIAFALQIRAQRELSPTTASLIYLLESPFALMFSFILLGERLDLIQSIGAALILLSVSLATVFASKPHKSSTAA